MNYSVRVRKTGLTRGAVGYATVAVSENGADILLIQNIMIRRQDDGQLQVKMPITKQGDRLLPAVSFKDPAFREELARQVAKELNS